MKKTLIKVLVSMAIVVSMASISAAEEIELVGVFTTQSVPESFGTITGIANALYFVESDAEFVSKDDIPGMLQRWKKETMGNGTSSLINSAIANQMNALVDLKVDVQHSFALHGQGAMINGTHGILTVSMTITATPVFIQTN